MRLRLIPLVILVAAGGGCLDLPPRLLPPVDSGAREEGGTTTPDGGPSACVECIMTPEDPGPGCGTSWDACKDEPRCRGLVECAEDANCFRISDLPTFLTCAQPCVEKFMLAGTTDPVYPLVTPIVFCTTGTGVCVPICSGP